MFCGECGKREEQGAKSRPSVLLGKRSEGMANTTLLKNLYLPGQVLMKSCLSTRLKMK